MIDLNSYLAFVLLATGIILLPGPNVLLIVATALSQGLRPALTTVAGTSSAMLIQLTIASVGTFMMISVLTELFVWLKWAGVLYLLWLGVEHLRAIGRPPSQQAIDESASVSFWRGFMVSLTNPKTLLFFAALLPQFVDPELPAGFQLGLLSLTFLVLAIVLDSLWAISAHATRSVLVRPQLQSWRHGISGTMLIGAGIGLALTKR